MQDIKPLSEEEANWWHATIKNFRERYVNSPQHYVDVVMAERNFTRSDLEQDIEALLVHAREQIYADYLSDESKLATPLIDFLTQHREIPRKIAHSLVDSRLLEQDKTFKDPKALYQNVIGIIGEYTGRIFPYLYEISLSNTQARRSRSGKTFEILFEKCLSLFEIPFENQSSLGTTFYREHNLSKKVDIIIPSRRAYEERRAECGVVSTKTTLRERWQQVVEELHRSNVPHIFLATLDDDISQEKVGIMRQHNITLVIRRDIKEERFNTEGSVESFQNFFVNRLPRLMRAWDDFAR